MKLGMSWRALKEQFVARPAATRIQVPPGGGADDTPYPAFDVASEDKWALDWDEKTRRLVVERLQDVPGYRFFSAPEVATLEAVCARVIPQDDRPASERVPIAPWIDARLASGKGDGYRYADMPADGEAYHLGLRGFDEAAQALFGSSFAELPDARRDEVLTKVAGGSPPGAAWRSLPPARFWQELASEVIENYYAHPAAWAEIGFNGPSSPRGHIRLGLHAHDPWEADETQPRSSVDIVRRADGRPTHAEGGPTH